MNRWFYPKLARTNLVKHSKSYIPYIITCICTVMMYYIIYALSKNKGLDHMSGGSELKMLLSLGTKVIAIFSVIFIFYTNSFLIKRRKKEFGLFNILGMEKQHLSKIMVYETVFVGLISIFIGLFGGILLNKFMFLILLRILNFKVQLGFEVSVSAMRSTLILFSIIFLLTLISAIFQIHLSKPIELIKGDKTGEREPKTKWLLVIIGLLSLGSGYYISITTKNPIDALNLFFVAVLLVILGTYCLFIAGSIALLKMLRKKKSYYYKTKHFISVSGMMYRMKQNAVGLANICILSTMVLVMLSTSVSLYIGIDDAIRTRYQRNILISSSNYTNDYMKEIQTITDDTLSKHNLSAKNLLFLRYTEILTKRNGSVFTTNKSILKSFAYQSKNLTSLCFIPLKDYNKTTGNNYKLENNEVLLYCNQDHYNEDTISIYDKTFTIKNKIKKFFSSESHFVSTYYIVVKNMTILDQVIEKTKEYGIDESLQNTIYGFDLNTGNKENIAFYKDLTNKLVYDKITSVESTAEVKETFFALYGGLFFLGIFLGTLFIIATILIIYYKQLSEGYEDKDRFGIMQKVGLSKEEVKKTIHSQVLSVFFLPLVMAVIHIVFAFPVITRCLKVLYLTNTTLYAICTIVTILIFAILYGIVYILTAREYYRIVK